MLSQQIKQDILSALKEADEQGLAILMVGINYAIQKKIPFGDDTSIEDNQEILNIVNDEVKSRGFTQAQVDAFNRYYQAAIAANTADIQYKKSKAAYEAVKNARTSKNNIIRNVAIGVGVLVVGYFALKYFKVIK